MSISRHTSHSSSCLCSCGLALCHLCSSWSTDQILHPPSLILSSLTGLTYLNESRFFANCLIAGDFNLHVSDVTNSSSLHFLTLLNSFNLSDRIGKPTRGDNQLGIFVCRSDQSAPVVRVDPPSLSNHSLIVGSFSNSSTVEWLKSQQ